MKAIIVGDAGELLTDKLKEKLKQFIELAVNEYKVTDFYFGNGEEEYYDDTDGEVKPYLKTLSKILMPSWIL